MSTRATFNSPEEERAYLKLGRLLLGRPSDEILKARA